MAEQTGHTPGPWAFNESFCEIREGEDGPPICDMLSAGISDWKANARLIAAAPELLAACEAAEHALRSYQYGNSATDLAHEIADQVAAAIAKARPS